MCNFSNAVGLFLFSHVNCNHNTRVSSIGFFITNTDYVILLACCCSHPLDVATKDDLFGLSMVLRVAADYHYSIKHICANNSETPAIIYGPAQVTTLSFNSQIEDIRSLLGSHGSPSKHCIPISWMHPAVSLATYGFNYSALNLFLFGHELPYSIMKAFTVAGFVF